MSATAAVMPSTAKLSKGVMNVVYFPCKAFAKCANSVRTS